MATTTLVGKTAIGGTGGGSSQNFKLTSKFTAVATGTSDTFWVYTQGPGSGSAAIRGVVYSDSSGSPSALLGTTAEISVAAAFLGWKSVSLAVAITSSTVYWLGVWVGPPGTSPGNGYYKDAGSSGDMKYNANTYHATNPPADPFGSPTSATDVGSFYLSVTTPDPAAYMSMMGVGQ